MVRVRGLARPFNDTETPAQYVYTSRTSHNSTSGIYSDIAPSPLAGVRSSPDHSTLSHNHPGPPTIYRRGGHRCPASPWPHPAHRSPGRAPDRPGLALCEACRLCFEGPAPGGTQYVSGEPPSRRQISPLGCFRFPERSALPSSRFWAHRNRKRRDTCTGCVCCSRWPATKSQRLKWVELPAWNTLQQLSQKSTKRRLT